MIQLQRAASRAHVSAQRWENMRAAVAISLALLALFSVWTGMVSGTVVVGGLAWFVVQMTYVNRQVQNATNKAALVQEQFDTELFRLPWNRLVAGDRLRDDEIQELARRFRELRKPLREKRERFHTDWYDVDTSGIPWPYDVFMCQRQNLSWDAKQRRYWARVLFGAIALWASFGIAVAVAAEMLVLDALLRFFAPSIPAIQVAASNATANLVDATQRDRAAQAVERELDAPNLPLSAVGQAEKAVLARQVQDLCWITRATVARVPQLIYQRLRSGYMDDFQQLSRQARQTFGLNTDSTN